MKNTNMFRRALALLLAVLMTVSCLAGCGGSSEPQQNVTASQDGDNELPTAQATVPQGEPDPDVVDEGNQESFGSTRLTAASGEKISYVMIYNPQIYTDDYSPAIRSTGNLSSQINVDLNRADDLTGESEIETYEQQPIDQELLDKINLDGGKAEGLYQYYRVGDRQDFYCGSTYDINMRALQTFTCVYAGTHANIWAYGNLDTYTLNNLGNAFDSSIYYDCVSRFGDARFGDVVNILVYPFEGNPNTVGFFYNLDLFSSMECDDLTARAYGMNRDHNVININSLWLEDETTMVSTLAHEFQHLLCFTGYFSAGNMCDIWFNEAMSGYIEEVLYPGIKEGHFAAFHTSQRIRYGQSLYNFGVDATAYSFDIGVYGSVYLFSEYLKNLAGDDIFSNFHANWRNTYVPMTTFEGIYQVMPDLQRRYIDRTINYPYSMQFASEEEEWMSKLTLAFYLATLTKGAFTSEQYREIVLPYLLYDSIMDAQIEGGGRVILATKNGTFTIPADADSGLVYVGLNENLEVVTDFVIS